MLIQIAKPKPLYYESRIIKLTVDDAAVAVAEAELEQAAAADAAGEEVANLIRIPLEALVGAPERIERLAAFIVDTGKSAAPQQEQY